MRIKTPLAVWHGLGIKIKDRGNVSTGINMNATATAQILQLDDFRRPLMYGFEAQGSESDLDCREKLFVQVVLSEARPELVGCTWSCRAAHVSATNLELLCDRPIPDGALVDLWVDLAACPGKFFLSGRVASSRMADRDHALTSIELEEGAATDFVAWVELHD